MNPFCLVALLPKVLSLSTLLFVPAQPAPALKAGTVRGAFTIGGQKSTATHVYAVIVPYSFDEKKEGLEIHIRTSAAKGWSETGSLDGEVPLVRVSLGTNGKLWSVFYIGDSARMESFGPDHIFEKKVLDGSRVAGRLRSVSPVSWRGQTYEIDVTFRAPILRQNIGK
jgi:hypothetical protein